MIILDSYKYLIRGIFNKYSEKKVKFEWDSILISFYYLFNTIIISFKLMYR